MGAFEHSLWVGSARWGKTTAIVAAILGAKLASCVIIDTQRQDFNGPDFQGWPRGESPEPIWSEPRYIWQPPIWSIGRQVTAGPWTRGLQLLVAGRLADAAHPRRGVTIVLDQLGDTAPPGLHPLMLILVRQGMARGCGLWGGVQDPYTTDDRFRTSAIHRFAGRVGSAAHRGLLASDWQCESLTSLLAAPPPHAWYAVPLGATEAVGPLDFRRLTVRRAGVSLRAAGSDPAAAPARPVAREPLEMGAPPLQGARADDGASAVAPLPPAG